MLMNEMKLLIMETLDNDRNKKNLNQSDTNTKTIDEVKTEIVDEFRASYESTFMFWRNSFVSKRSSRNGSNVSNTHNSEHG